MLSHDQHNNDSSLELPVLRSAKSSLTHDTNHSKCGLRMQMRSDMCYIDTSFPLSAICASVLTCLPHPSPRTASKTFHMEGSRLACCLCSQKNWLWCWLWILTKELRCFRLSEKTTNATQEPNDQNITSCTQNGKSAALRYLSRLGIALLQSTRAFFIDYTSMGIT